MQKFSSYIIIAIQLLSFFYILVSGPLIPIDPILFLTQLFAIGISLWGAYDLFKYSKFSVLPELSKHASVVKTGIFQYVRHPIYSGMILYALVSLVNYTTLYRFLALLVLVLVLLYKLHIEEDHLEKRFGEEYKRYKEKTKRIIPFVY